MKTLLLSCLVSTAFAYPGMSGNAPPGDHHAGIFGAIIKRTGERLHEEYLQKRSLYPRQGGPPVQPVVLIGDLQLKGTGGTAVNEQIMDCFNNQNGTTCQSFEQYSPPAKDTTACAADTCCIWSYIKDDLVPLFQETDGTCNDVARACVRFGFHDAGTWKTGLSHGGADGSLLLDPTEVLRPANAGLDRARNALLPIWEKYKSYGISAADLVQYAHNVAIVVCPLGPRSLTYVGRPDWSSDAGVNQDGLLPDAKDSADNLINLFGNKTITSIELVALLGAHTAGKQRFFDTTQANKPFDTTPGVWDVAFYSQILNGTTPCGTFHLPSDNFMGANTRAKNGFVAMSNGFPFDNSAGQVIWDGLYSKAYLRLSLLGVNKIQGLTDCTKTLPNPITSFVKPKSAIVSCDVGGSKASNSSVSSNSTIGIGKNGTTSTISSALSLPTSPSSTSSGPAVQSTSAGNTLKALSVGLWTVFGAVMALAL